MTHPTLKPDAHIRVELLSNPTYTSGMKDLVHAVAKPVRWTTG